MREPDKAGKIVSMDLIETGTLSQKLSLPEKDATGRSLMLNSRTSY
jgi:hypothetical protein